MPCIGLNNPYYRIPTAEELQKDIKKCFQLYDVSQYLSKKTEDGYKEYLLKKQL
jgi:hypothetical protein